MGFLNLFSKKSAGQLARLPAGSFSVDRDGRIVASTLPQGFPQARLEQIGSLVQATFRSAQEANVPLRELVVDYAAFKLTARELRGGAMIFLAPPQTAPKSPG